MGSKSLMENVVVLLLLGVLAGAVGGLGVGLITSRASSTTTGSSTH